jgi:endonuclease G, mitochondrial
MTSHTTARAKRFLKQVLPSGGLEGTLSEPGGLESMAEAGQVPSAELEVVRATLEKLEADQDLSPREEFALEAIIIPDQRPAVDVVAGDFEVRHQLWLHYGRDPIRSRIRTALPSIGRVEVSGIPNLPYGGTGFVVGPRLIMTNRHVAALFTSGRGLRELTFLPGIRAGIDFKRERGLKEKQFLRVRKVVMIHPHWDMALLEVDGLSERNPSLVLSLDRPDQLVGREIAVVGYPAFDPRNPADVQNRVFGNVYYVKRLQPGQLGARRVVRSFDHTVSAMTHDASTLGGNSGSAVLDVTSGTIVALHFAGVYLDANFTVPSWELSRDQRVIDAGVKFRSAVPGDSEVTEEWWGDAEAPTRQLMSPSASPPSGVSQPTFVTASGGATWTIPIQITVQLGAGARLDATTAADAQPPAGDVTEKMVIPTHDPDYSTRGGYLDSFLGVEIPLPEPVDETLCAPLLEGEGRVLDYHHFSLVMHQHRRLAMLAASNLDAAPSRKKPEPGRSYTRKALGGLGKNDVELWLTDPRIAPEHQLPDRFFTRDQGAFDRGHVVRREDVAWGDSYQEVQFANGDTFHTTNCSPQVAGFNQPGSIENWGDLEKFVSAQAGADRLTVFAGPVLAEDDPIFLGVDSQGAVRVKIPQQYWKVILAIEGDELRAFAFLLRQDLSDVSLEFAVDAAWREHMVGVAELEELLGIVRFPEVVRQADQIHTDNGEAVRSMAGI